MSLKVTFAVPNRNDFCVEMVSSLMRLITGSKAHITLSMPQTCYIDQARNTCFEDAKAFDSDWLLFMDTDNSFDNAFNVLEHMISLGKDIVSGVYVQRAHPFRPLVYNFTDDGLIKNWSEIPDKPFKADATGCGLLLISRKVLDAFTPEVIEKYGQPFDFLNYGKPNMLREDPAFCWRAKQLGFEVWFDPEISMGHHGRERFSLAHYEAAKKQAMLMDHVKDGGIDGWMTQKELEFLAAKAYNMQTIAEIGSWKGRSTKTLLSFCSGTVTAIDHWKGTPEIEEIANAQNVEAEFDKNVGSYPNLRKMKMSSLEAAASLNGDMFDMVFIDASHDYKSVMSDINAWLPRTKRVIAGHDYHTKWPGVMRAVNEKFGNKVKLCDSIWFVEL